jgi:arylsulfatase A-like enzyme
MLGRYRASRIPGEGGDLVVEPAYGCLLSPWPAGTSHGSPHDYDRDVPLVFFGPGVEPGRVAGNAAPVDIAPTLAAALGLDVPQGLDGRVLPLRGDGAGGL